MLSSLRVRLPLVFLGGILLAGLVTTLIAVRLFQDFAEDRAVAELTREANGIARLYANAINEALVARPGIWATRALVFLDNKGVDGLVNGTAALLGGTSGRVRRLQTGFVRTYALGMLGGSVLVIATLLAVSL